MPFGFDANDYPVHGQQNIVVQTMEDVYFASAPTDFSYRFFSGDEGMERSGSMGTMPSSGNGENGVSSVSSTVSWKSASMSPIVEEPQAERLEPGTQDGDEGVSR